jgi:hypothetical protein
MGPATCVCPVANGLMSHFLVQLPLLVYYCVVVCCASVATVPTLTESSLTTHTDCPLLGYDKYLHLCRRLRYWRGYYSLKCILVLLYPH